MSEKVLGLSEVKVQELVNKYGCVICKQDFVEVVTVEWLEKYCKRKNYINDCFPEIGVNGLLKAVRLQVNSTHGDGTKAIACEQSPKARKCITCGHEIVLEWISLKNKDKGWYHKINNKYFQIGCPHCDCNSPYPDYVIKKEGGKEK